MFVDKRLRRFAIRTPRLVRVTACVVGNVCFTDASCLPNQASTEAGTSHLARIEDSCLDRGCGSANRVAEECITF